MAAGVAIGDAAACVAQDPAHPTKWVPTLRAMVQLPVALFGEPVHAPNLTDIARAVVGALRRDGVAPPDTRGAVSVTLWWLAVGG